MQKHCVSKKRKRKQQKFNRIEKCYKPQKRLWNMQDLKAVRSFQFTGPFKVNRFAAGNGSSKPEASQSVYDFTGK